MQPEDLSYYSYYDHEPILEEMDEEIDEVGATVDQVIKEQQEQTEPAYDPAVIDVKTGDIIQNTENNATTVKQEYLEQQQASIPVNVKVEEGGETSQQPAQQQKRSSSKIFKCGECQKAFKHQRKLLKHVARRHGANVSFKPPPPPPSAPRPRVKRSEPDQSEGGSIAERIARATANGEVDVSELSAKEVSYDHETDRWQCQVINEYLIFTAPPLVLVMHRLIESNCSVNYKSKF